MTLVEMYQELLRLGLIDAHQDAAPQMYDNAIQQTNTSFQTDIYVDITAGETDHAKLGSGT